jgi:hypothetical protein
MRFSILSTGGRRRKGLLDDLEHAGGGFGN